MRILILVGVAAAALTLTACNREEPADATADSSMAADSSGSMSADSSGGAMSADSGSGSTSSGDGSATASSGSMPATEPVEAPVSEATRQGAKEKAESTNLHPPTNRLLNAGRATGPLRSPGVDLPVASILPSDAGIGAHA